MQILQRLFRREAEAPMTGLYAAIVAEGRAEHWYVEGRVPDTIEGRFDMIATVLSFVLLRLEGDPEGVAPSTALAERFIDDMDGQLREIGIGDVVVGKHVGKMMGMLGGRLGAYRDGLAAGSIDTALVRNLYRGETPDGTALTHTRESLMRLRESLAAMPTAALLAGALRP